MWIPKFYDVMTNARFHLPCSPNGLISTEACTSNIDCMAGGREDKDS